MSNRLTGRVALVTGAARGIGAALAQRLAQEGAAVAAVDLSAADETVEAIEASGGKAASYLTDITEKASVDALAETITSELGSVDILVNNAGIYPVVSFEDLTAADWRKVFAVNVDAMFYTAHAFLPAMKTNGWGRVVNVASNSVALQVPGQTHYIASKLAVVGLTRGIATEYGQFGITANAIAPSAVHTPGTSDMPEEGFQALAQAQSIKRSSVPQDLAGTLAFLASEDASFITGQTLYVDGGLVRAL
ncbi:SDR family NAD(P)-dependent oxidoreductase [Amycolatopsis pithecellobii]|uniref:SDR family oxidoreductase n=1 Tax=Amycolatopsis pithecellobii TaxID=664692 RepID=A0A6N7YU66_9PSEU|nr:SDR family NAD(P)-dependent oxidoreductase [Amycolatopsis pithecellobii]MTD55482.1 SDR family oxidoreductase [Amycolatopsis pithecellobii]